MLNLSDDPSLSQAVDELGRAEAEEAKATPAAKPESTIDTAKDGDRGPKAEETEVQSPDPDKDGAPAAKDPAKAGDPSKPAESKEPKAEDKKASDDKRSNFAKSKERRERTWTEINAEKEAVRAEAEKIKSEREALAKEKTEFETQRQKASQPKHKPEDYEQAAKTWLSQADKLEDDGDFEGAAAKRALAKQAGATARHLRENPPKTTEQQAAAARAEEEKFKPGQKEWWAKAAIDYPESAKPGSAVALKIKSMITPGDPAYDAEVAQTVLNTPKGLYYVARLVSAETLAASASDLKKENGDLRAKVKELAGKLQIPMDGAVTTQTEKPYSAMSEQEQEEALRRETSGQDASWHG